MTNYSLYTLGFDPQKSCIHSESDFKDYFNVIDLPSTQADALQNSMEGSKDKAKDGLILINEGPIQGELENVIKTLSNETKLPIVIMGNLKHDEKIANSLKLGASDFIDQSTPKQTLLQKLSTLAKNSSDYRKSEEKFKNAQSAAFSAMSDSAEIGHALHFVTDSIDCKTFEHLAEAIFNTYGRLGLKGSIRIYPPDEAPLFFSSDQDDKPIEVKLFDSYRNEYLQSTDRSSRFITFNQRILTYTDHCALLVKNATEEKQGRLRDILGAITTGLESSTLRIININQERIRKDILKSVIYSVKDTTITFENQFENYEKTSATAIDNFMANLNIGLSSLSLTEDQEEYFIKLANDTMQQLISRYSEEVALKNLLGDIITKLRSLAKVL